MSKIEKDEDTETSSEEDSEEEEEEITIKSDDARNKNQTAAKFADQALEAIIKECIPGKLIGDLCQLGDKIISDLTSKVYNKGKGEKKVEKGIAFPTCVSVNNVVCHYSPLKDDTTTLKESDIVRIDLGVHIDGHISQVAHTVVVQTVPQPITGKIADLVVAAQQCIEAALHLMKPGNKNNDIPPVWAKIAEQFDVTICEGVLSHKLKRFVLDGNESIISKPTFEQKVEDYEFQECEVWTLDIVLTNGANKLRQHDARPLIYKRCPDQQYLLKLKASRDVMKEINQNYSEFPFSIRALETKSAVIGVSDCAKHDLVAAFPVLSIKPGELCCHFKSTVFITQNATKKVNNVAVKQPFVSEKKITDENTLKLLETPLLWGKVTTKTASTSSPKASPKASPKKAPAASSSSSSSSSKGKVTYKKDEDEEDGEEEEGEGAAKAKSKRRRRKKKAETTATSSSAGKE